MNEGICNLAVPLSANSNLPLKASKTQSCSQRLLDVNEIGELTKSKVPFDSAH